MAFIAAWLPGKPASRQAGRTDIHENVEPGTQRDAILYSLGANGTHGLYRTNADKRNAVQTMLKDPEWAAWPQEKIAKTCHVSAGLVSKLVSQASLHGEEIKPATRTVERNGKTYQQDTANIGKAKPALPTSAQAIGQREASDEAEEGAPDASELALLAASEKARADVRLQLGTLERIPSLVEARVWQPAALPTSGDGEGAATEKLEGTLAAASPDALPVQRSLV